MRDLILGHEPAIRLGFFFGVLAVMALWEIVAPLRPASLGRWARWPSNLGIVALNTVLARLLLPPTAVALALVGEREGWGFLHNVGLPGWLANIPWSGKMVKRLRHTESQTKLNMKQRALNIADAFKVIRFEEIQNKNVLLVDDVSTTGATILECAKMIKAAGAKKVYACTVGTTSLEDDSATSSLAQKH